MKVNNKKAVPKKATPSAEQPVKLTQIIKFSTDRGYKDISDWQSALMQAENQLNPKRTQLLNLYEQLIMDAHIRMIRKQLRMHVTSGEFQIVDGKKTVDIELTKLFKKAWFKKFLYEVIDTVFFGHTLLQIRQADPTTGTINIDLVPRKNVVPELGGWLEKESDMANQAIVYRNNPAAMNWLIEIETDGFGELNPAAPYIMFKKNAMSCWSEFCERFGMPLAKAKVNARDINAINRMENFLVKMGSSSYAIIDQSEEIDFVESTKTDAFQVYDKLIERCNGELSKMILLQIMGNDVGANGSRAQAQVHDVRSDEVRASMREWIESLVNEVLLPILAVHGFKTNDKSGGYLEVKKVDKDTFDQDKWLEENFEVPVEHWSQKYNTPILARKAKALPTPPIDPNADPNAKVIKQQKTVETFLKSPVNSIIKMHREIHELFHHENHDDDE